MEIHSLPPLQQAGATGQSKSLLSCGLGGMVYKTPCRLGCRWAVCFNNGRSLLRQLLGVTALYNEKGRGIKADSDGSLEVSHMQPKSTACYACGCLKDKNPVPVLKEPTCSACPHGFIYQRLSRSRCCWKDLSTNCMTLAKRGIVMKNRKNTSYSNLILL